MSADPEIRKVWAISFGRPTEAYCVDGKRARVVVGFDGYLISGNQLVADAPRMPVYETREECLDACRAQLEAEIRTPEQALADAERQNQYYREKLAALDRP